MLRQRGASLELARVYYSGVAQGAVSLAITEFAMGDLGGVEIGSCAPVIETAAECLAASVTIE